MVTVSNAVTEYAVWEVGLFAACVVYAEGKPSCGFHGGSAAGERTSAVMLSSMLSIYRLVTC